MENAMILLCDICRLCLDEPGTDNIFEPVDMSQDIFIYTGVKVITTDGMPQTICASCRDIINCVKILKDIANVNDRQLQTLRGSNDQSTHSQNESGGRPDITSSVNVSLKSRLIFEDDVKDKLKSKTDKLRRKKRKSLSKPENSSAPKIIAVRTDLYESSATVSSSSSRHMESSPTKDLTSSKYSEKEGKDDENSASSNKTVTSSTKKCTPSPTPTTSPNKDPEKLVKVGENTPKVFKFEHQCETCNKSYATPKKLYLHQLAHNKKFLCPLDVCGKKFAIKGDLQKHIRSHTGEKPFKCDLCEQSFTQKGSLKTHKENIHNEPQSQTPRTEYSQ